MNLAELVIKVDEPCWVGVKGRWTLLSWWLKVDEPCWVGVIKVDEPCWVGDKGRWTTLAESLTQWSHRR